MSPTLRWSTTHRVLALTFLCLTVLASLNRAATIPAAEDTYCARGKVTVAANKATVLSVDAATHAYVYFSLADLPPNAQIRYARLRVYFSTVRRIGSGLSVYQVTSHWSEGAAGAEPTYATPEIGTIAAENIRTKAFASLDVTSAVQAWLADPASNQGLAIGATDGATTASVRIGAKEGSGSGYPAELEVELAGAGIAGAVTSNDLAPNLTLGGTTIGTFSGNAAGLTSLKASNITGQLGMSQIGNGAIGNSQLGPKAVQTGNIADQAVGSLQLAPNLTLSGTTTGLFSGDGSALTGLNATNLTAGTISNARLPGSLPGLAGLPITSYGTSLLTQDSSTSLQSSLGLDGYVYVFLGMGGYRNGQSLYCALSRDGLTWTVANDGHPVYAAPSGGVRDASPYYEKSTGWFYACYTAGDYGLSGYFGVARSKTPWTAGTWEHVKDVGDPVGTPVDSAMAWGPSFYEDPNGVVHVFIACSSSDFNHLTLYETHPVVPGAFNGAWSDFTEVTMPGQQFPWNEVKVFRSQWTGQEYMIAWDFYHNQPEILKPTVPGVYTAWTLVKGLAPPLDVIREGPFPIERPNGDGWWVYTEYAGDYTVYKRLAFSASWQLESTSFQPIVEVPGAAYPNGPGLANGEVILVRHPIAASIGGIAPVGIAQASQGSSNVAITGGSVTIDTQFASKGIDNSWDSTGYAWEDNAGNKISRLVLGTANRIYWRMPTSGAGMQWYNGTGDTAIASLTDIGGFSITGELKSAALSVGGANGATGTSVKGLRHGVATLVAGTVTINDANVTASSRIFLTAQSLGTVTVPQMLAVTDRTPGTSFTIKSANNTDTSVVAWEMIEP